MATYPPTMYLVFLCPWLLVPFIPLVSLHVHQYLVTTVFSSFNKHTLRRPHCSSHLFSFGFASVQTPPSVFARKSHSFAPNFIPPYPPPHHPFSLSSCTFLGRQSSLCSPYDIIQCRLQPVYATVQVLAALDSASLDTKQRETVSPSNSASSGGSQCRSLVSVTTQTPPPSWQMWDLIGSSLLHVLCLTLLFVAYSWIELT